MVTALSTSTGGTLEGDGLPQPAHATTTIARPLSRLMFPPLSEAEARELPTRAGESAANHAAFRRQYASRAPAGESLSKQRAGGHDFALVDALFCATDG